MIVKESELQEARDPIHYGDASDVTLQRLKDDLTDCAHKMGLPIFLELGQVKGGSIWKPEMEDCLILYNPEHEKDYYKFCIRLVHIGVSGKVWFYSFGSSKQMNKLNLFQQARDGAVKNGGGEIMANVMASLFTPGLSKKKLENEGMYYDLVLKLFENVFLS